MIRLVHFADLHIGSDSYGTTNPDTGLSTRTADFLSSLDKIVDYAIDESVDCVLFAGDAYKIREPSPTHQREFAIRVMKLSKANIPTVLLVGNHDVSPARGRATSVDIFGVMELPNITVVSKPQVLKLDMANGVLQIVALPWLPKGAEAAIEIFLRKSLKRLDPDVPTVALAHCSVSGAEFGSERKTMLGVDELVPITLLDRDEFDYVALGHIHKHQALGIADPKKVVYSGSIERVDFGEEKDEKGFVVADVDVGELKWKFVSTDARPFVTVRVEAVNGNVMRKAERAIGKVDTDGAVVRVVVHTISEFGGEIDDKQIRKWMTGAFYLTIVREIEREERQQLISMEAVETLSSRQLLRRYFEAKGFDKARIKTLMNVAKEIME